MKIIQGILFFNFQSIYKKLESFDKLLHHSSDRLTVPYSLPHITGKSKTSPNLPYMSLSSASILPDVTEALEIPMWGGFSLKWQGVRWSKSLSAPPHFRHL